jgi:hypothetical protein
VVCTASDSCHTAGTCNSSTGLCSNPNKSDGTSCSDGNLCTTGDKCQAGSCVGSAVTCTVGTPVDACNAVSGACNPTTGTCAVAPLPDSTWCAQDCCLNDVYCSNGTCPNYCPSWC